MVWLKTSNLKNKGFTLAELLVVIAIIGLLSSIVLVGTKTVREKAKITAIYQFSSEIYHALGAYTGGNFDFNEGAGSKVNDKSGYGNNGTIYQGSLETDGGWKCTKEATPIGKGCSLCLCHEGCNPAFCDVSSKNDNIKIPHYPSLLPTSKGFTIELWIRIGSLSESPIVQKGDCSSGYKIYINYPAENYLTFCFNNASVQSQNPASKYLNTWLHLVAVKTPTNLYLYENAVLVGTSTGNYQNPTTTSDLLIGDPLGGAFQIYLFRIYDEALTSAQISQRPDLCESFRNLRDPISINIYAL